MQESFLKDLKEYCETHQLEDAYRAYRYLVITQPALGFVDYRQHVDRRNFDLYESFYDSISHTLT
ncbi:MAG: hypothetical protein KME43_15380 [Myxacorys chilensis ATA2-1-KO14]|nr:hypothetical protein [Myxacorys chilensis ATA2-1-KO14]